MAIKSGKKALFTEINITPLTDIFLVLLIIMMVVAPTFQSIDTSITVPEINSGTSIEQGKITVSVTQSGDVYIETKKVDINSLATELENLKKDTEATEENSDPEDIQLGLIADDVKDHKLFKYIGVESTYEEEISTDVTETKTRLGLQALPLVTAALTACKYLIERNTEIETRLATIEEQLADLLDVSEN